MIPHTPLSLAYHVTLIDPYREELHTDLREALRRFEIKRTFKERFPVDAEQEFIDFARASFAIERAAFAGRDDPEEKKLQVPMAAAAARFFESVARHLEWEIKHKPPNDDQPITNTKRPTLLWLVYHLFYSKVFRRSARSLPAWTEPTATTERADAWRVVHGALEGESVGSDLLRDSLAVLTQWLAFEYSNAIDPTWKFCW